jgi:glycosyltransferase involved in cell wall biosynthesis
MNAQAPRLAVVVASHNRALRLRWLLNSLEEQTLPRGEFEVLVAYDSDDGGATERLLRDHPVGARALCFDAEPGVPTAPKLRNAGWRAATAPLVVFTDDDCRAPADWLANIAAAADANPGAIVQGMTMPDPEEEPNAHGAWPHTQRIVPPVPWAQTCNILYPRELLDRVGGFREDPPLSMGEDTELALRAIKAGAGYVGAPTALTWHAVDDQSIRRGLRSLPRWGDVALLIKLHPDVRGDFPMWGFWKRTHVWLPVAAAGVAMSRRNPAWLALVMPWAAHTAPAYGEGNPRGRLRAASELPLRALIDAAEMVACVRGAIRHRTFFL